jgi:hypothetical protein
MKIIDNFLEKELIEYLKNVFMFKTPHLYGHKSHEKSNFFYNSDINMDDTLIKFIILKLQKEFKFNEVLRSYINVQFYGMEGDWHTDDGKNTILLMVTKTLKNGSGDFQIKMDNKINKVGFVQNRLIFFDASFQHRGLAPKELNTPRITFAFKTI